jgi:6-phosphofructokinase 1
MTLPSAAELEIEVLGEATRASPIADVAHVPDDCRILASADMLRLRPYFEHGEPLPCFERAGPRERIFFEPSDLVCGIVTCGGLCPGLNDVIRSIVLTLRHMYGVERVLGFRYGYAGLGEAPPAEPMELDPRVVRDIHNEGGTILGSSRGPQAVSTMVDTLVRHRVGILFTIGGDGTLRGAQAIAGEIRARGLPIAVVGIPKTIDNDLKWTTRSFGFATAVDEAKTSLAGAHAEAIGAWNGIGLVKLMGRHSGFIAAHATLSSSDVNFCMVPEVPFALEGEDGLLAVLERRIAARHHAVIVVAEGAGQELLERDGPPKRDASGNVKLGDIGTFLKQRIEQHFRAREIPISIKYIDPSYTIRSVRANPLDSEFCLVLGQHAVHAGMSGRTNLVVGHWNQAFVHVPIELATSGRRNVDPRADLWRSVLHTTGQPANMGSPREQPV